ncbi:hypothetical protein RUM44_001022 [Polyplax serrata]|uniref:Uncharacterized protein n=1 Tax=Polyplax serrata TaxID=468196 RepID=A0ABR1B6J2_POLSC
MELFRMSSKDEDRSLTSGIPIPQWMRSKTENYGFDPSTLSPPTHEGDFFYIKLPMPQPAQSLNLNKLTEVIQVKERAFDKHTDSCKQFIPIIQDSVQVQKPKVTKPMGVDDGFKGEGAACGASVVEVAHQMLHKSKGFRPLTRVETDGSLAPPPTYLQTRRNSKSLPVSPVTSPRASPIVKRKNDDNTRGALSGLQSQSDDGLCESEENIEKKVGSSWILSSLFAGNNENKKLRQDLVKEKGALVAAIRESNIVRYRGDTSKPSQSGEPINTQAVDVTITSSAGPPKNSIFKSKPYLRDLNLLTPSSM